MRKVIDGTVKMASQRIPTSNLKLYSYGFQIKEPGNESLPCYTSFPFTMKYHQSAKT